MTAAASDMKVAIPAEARKSCGDLAAPLPEPPPDKPKLAAFGVGQTGALEICDQRRALGVAAGDLHNLYVDRLAEGLKPPSLGERVFGRRHKPPPKPTLDELEGISRELAPTP